MQHGKVIRDVQAGCVDCGVRGWIIRRGNVSACACNPTQPDTEDTAPVPKLDPETRPNVPPRMM